MNLKLTINQNAHIQETEITINCAAIDSRIRNLANYLRQYSASLEGKIDDSTYYVPLDSILYIDSVDRRTFFYDRHRIFSSRYTLSELEEKLENTQFIRISKCCMVNLAYVQRTCPYENHRLEVVMSNGEHLIAARSCRDSLKAKLREFHADTFYAAAPFAPREIFAHCPERSVYNAGKLLSFPSSPKRAAALSYESAEILAALGLAERLIAISPAESTLEYVLPQYRSILNHVPLLTEQNRGVPTLKELKELDADFIFGTYYALHYLERVASAKVSDYQINLYVSEGTIPERATMEGVYRDILNIGRIFHVEDRSIELVEQFRKRIAVMTRSITLQKPVRVFVYDSGESVPYTSMKGTLENHLIALAGGQNIFGAIEKVSGTVAWEQIAQAAPEVIVVHDYVDMRSAQQKIELLNSRKELENVPAIRNGRFVIVSQNEIFPGVQNVNAVEKFIRAFHPGLL